MVMKSLSSFFCFLLLCSFHSTHASPTDSSCDSPTTTIDHNTNNNNNNNQEDDDLFAAKQQQIHELLTPLLEGYPEELVLPLHLYVHQFKEIATLDFLLSRLWRTHTKNVTFWEGGGEKESVPGKGTSCLHCCIVL